MCLLGWLHFVVVLGHKSLPTIVYRIKQPAVCHDSPPPLNAPIGYSADRGVFLCFYLPFTAHNSAFRGYKPPRSGHEVPRSFDEPPSCRNFAATCAFEAGVVAMQV